MSLFTTLHTGASGLGVSSTFLSVVGDNIANINTTGYKQSRATFADFLPQDVFGLNGSNQVGTGAGTAGVATLFGQGTLEATDSSTDMAINGNGFFIVKSGTESYYTRSGAFGVDDSGYLVNDAGMKLQGYSAQAGSISAALGDIKINTAGMAGSATSTISLDATLSADEDVADDLSALDFYGTGTGASTLTDAADAADFSTSVTVYDSLGVGHDVTVLFERTSDTDWSWRAVTDASAVYDSTGAQYSTTENTAFEMATGTISFDTDGNPTAFTQTDTAGYTFLGTATPAIAFDFGIDTTGTATDGNLRMVGETSAVSSIAQDGYSAGSLSAIEVDIEGTITGSYTNGEQITLGQVALATFDSTAGLERVGGTLFEATTAAGDPAVGIAGTGGRGTIAGNALEQSNVELEDQFVSMITAQRTYQANSKVISTVNETLANLLQIL